MGPMCGMTPIAAATLTWQERPLVIRAQARHWPCKKGGFAVNLRCMYLTFCTKLEQMLGFGTSVHGSMLPGPYTAVVEAVMETRLCQDQAVHDGCRKADVTASLYSPFHLLMSADSGR